MSEVYVISDIHIGHRNILTYRQEFDTIEEHDNTILENCLKLSKRDTLWLLGDCFFTMESIDFLRELRKKIRNVKWILGNHDTDRGERQDVVRKILNEGLVGTVGSLFKSKGHVWLSHHPIHPDELRGCINVHGHVHRETIRDDRYVNVCVENINYAPVKYADLLTEESRRRVLNVYGEERYD